MASMFEFVLAKTNVLVNSNNGAIVNQIKEYEKQRNMLYGLELGSRLIAKQLKRSSMEKSANRLRAEADRMRAEAERLDRNILCLIDNLKPQLPK